MAEPLRFTAIDHFSITVANQPRQLEFYSKLFGANLRKERDAERFYVRLGSSYLAIGQAAQGRKAGFIDHFCAGCEGMWLQPVEERLTEIGVQYTNPPPFGIFFADPDGVRIQMWMEDSWTDVARTAPPYAKSIAEPPLFESVRIAGLNIGVPDVAKAEPYYARLFGAAKVDADKQSVFTVGKSTLTLRKAAAEPAIESAYILVREIRDGVSARIRELGGTPDAAVKNERIAFRDPEGVKLMVVAG